MNPQIKIAFLIAFLSLLLFAPFAHGQRRGMGVSSGGSRSGSSIRSNRGGEFDRRGGRRFENGFGFPYAPFYYPDYYCSDGDSDNRDPEPIEPPYQTLAAQPQQPPAPPPVPPGDTLVLENHDGQWERIPTGGELLNAAKPPKTELGLSSNTHGTNAQVKETEPPRPVLPPAVLVFRDGHREEVQKYMIKGADLYATATYSATGSWTKTIHLADLDIPASLKVNKDRGTKFNLPSGPNEVVVRF
jgi:hypothetical protein